MQNRNMQTTKRKKELRWNSKKCIHCFLCANLCEAVFGYDAKKMKVFLRRDKGGERVGLKEGEIVEARKAVRGCPVGAINIK
jgi:ferredoxin